MDSAHEHRNISEKAPHFFTFLLDHNLQLGKLTIPQSFTRKHGKGISHTVLLRVPSGAEWQVKLTKGRTGVWFLHGLKQFTEYYSLQKGHFLLFRYLGKSNFCVIICDTSALEIEYPVHDTNTCVQQGKFKRKSCSYDGFEGTEKGEGSMKHEIPGTLKPLIASKKSRYKFQSHGVELEKPKEKSASSFQQDLGGGGGGRHMATGKEQLISQIIPRRTTALSSTEMARALQMAKSLVKPESPFFMVPMQPSYVIQGSRLHIPSAFAHKHLPNKDHGDILLWDSNGRNWPLKYDSRTSRHRSPNIEFTRGWKEFMREHDLEIGDACVFELIDRIEFSFKVTILRVNQYADGNPFERKKVMKTEESEGGVSTKMLDGLLPSKTREKISSSMYGTREEGGRFMTSAQRWLKHDDFGNLKPLVACKKSRALQMADSFKSKNPFFAVCMQPSHVYKGFKLSIPTSFATKYFLKDHGYINLHSSSGGPWQVKYVRYKTAHNTHRVDCTVGWKAFAQDNKLEAGDVCVLELNKGSESSLEVVIYRSHEDTNNSDRDTGDDNDDQVLDGEKAPGMAPLSCLGPQKMNTNCLGNQSNGVKPKRKPGLSFQQDLEGGGRRATGKKHGRPGIPRRTIASSSTEMATSLVKPESPFFMVSMQPSYVIHGLRLHVPSAFVQKHFPSKDHGDVMLRDSNGRTWLVKYGSRTSKHRAPKVEFTHGWNEFMQEHDLEVGDACVFELINSIKFSFKVTILRANHYADGNHFERKKVIKTEESEMFAPWN